MKQLQKFKGDEGFLNISLASPETFGKKETMGTIFILYGIIWGIINEILNDKIRNIVDRIRRGLEIHTIYPDGF